MVNTITKEKLDFVFGPDSRGLTPEDRAKNSKQLFIRSQEQLAPYRGKGSGHVLSAWEALTAYKFETLVEAIDYGSAVLKKNAIQVGVILKQRRQELGLEHKTLSKTSHVSVPMLKSIEENSESISITEYERVARALGIDDRQLFFNSSERGDANLAVRLRSLRSDKSLKLSSVAALSEAAWVISTQNRLLEWLDLKSNEGLKFERSAIYGQPGYPSWQHGQLLAQRTRQMLKLGSGPIDSLRDLCEKKLQIPVIQVEMDSNICGATISTNGVRGIVVNLNGENSNVWIRRFTVAHELGHLLWDTEERLKSLRVDNYEDQKIENITDTSVDYVEQRANSFAAEFLAPQSSVEATYNQSSNSVRAVMEKFGASYTLVKYQIWNSKDRSIKIESLKAEDRSHTDDWEGQENFAIDYFKPTSTPPSRRGQFANLTIKALKANLLSRQTAASYLCIEENELDSAVEFIESIYE
jgi:Zn-dependent peptidase ImmA (M78 family)/transcriptional regulator with XRE-family HTH domain